MPGTTPLIHALRHDLDLVGVRTGCGIGECGACTVLLDGQPIRSCITPVSEAVDHQVTTPEGLGTPASPHPIQRAFIDRQAAQCGYCVNGIIMTVAGLATRGVDSDQEITDAIDEHLCRCGTHVRLRAAARAALGLQSPSPTSGGEELVTSGCQEPTGEQGAGKTTWSPPGELEPVVAAHPRVEQWLELAPDGRVLAHTGKIEMGQGIRTAFAQIVATQIGVSVDRVNVLSTRTGRDPDQWFTAGSLSIEDGGSALARAGAAFTRVLRCRAAAHLGVALDGLQTSEVGFVAADGGATVTMAELAEDGPVTGIIQPSDVPRWQGGALGRAVPRQDLIAKLTGAPAYLHDLKLDQMLYGRVVLPPNYDARLLHADLDTARALPGVVGVHRDGSLVVVIAERDDQALRAVARLRQELTWDDSKIEVPADVHEAMRDSPAEPFRVREDEAISEHLDSAPAATRATYTTPYQSHGSVAPSVAVARWDGGHLELWVHSQGVYPLRRELAALLALDEDNITIQHADGPGGYGMNGADDAAGFAAIAARAMPGRPVRVQLSLEDEFGWEPYGPAMAIDLEAGLDTSGRICAWRHHGFTDVHMTRPQGAGDRLVASWLRHDGVARPWPGAAEGGARNAVPLYDIPVLDVVADHVRGPLRTAALRCLGAYANIFATESFIDELAELAGQDPVQFRRAHLRDDRARVALDLAVEKAGWTPRVGPSGRGLGVAVAHYKDSKAYVAQAVDVDVEPDTGEIRVRRVVLACDAGVVVNPDGIRNQLEGGTLQGLSRALFEEQQVGSAGPRNLDWTTYPVIRFRHVPDIEIHLIDRSDQPPLGAGEAATPVIAAAVANAIDDAVGIRLRDLPLTPDRLERRLLEMNDREAARVRL